MKGKIEVENIEEAQAHLQEAAKILEQHQPHGGALVTVKKLYRNLEREKEEQTKRNTWMPLVVYDRNGFGGLLNANVDLYFEISQAGQIRKKKGVDGPNQILQETMTGGDHYKLVRILCEGDEWEFAVWDDTIRTTSGFPYVVVT